MSTSKKRKTKTKAVRKAKARTPRKHAAPSKKVLEKEAGIPPEAPPQRKEVPEKTFLIAIRIKGEFGAPSQMVSLLSGLRLNRKFTAALFDNNPMVLGTLRQAKDYLTFGEVKTKDVAALFRERGEAVGSPHLTDKTAQEKFGEQSVDELVTALAQGRLTLKALWQKGLKPVFRLRPPSGGFEGSTKRPYRSGGELGYRGLEISSLVTRMI